MAYTAGDGITLTGASFSFRPAAGGGLLVGPGGASVNTAVVARKFTSAPIGDGTATSFTIVHNLGTTNPIISVRTASGGDRVYTGEAVTDANTVTITASPAPSNGFLVVTVIG